jgi:predicted nucleic acid-binding protein
VEILVDSSVWSLVLRRSKEPKSESDQFLIALLRDLIQDQRARLIGPIRQELLSGIREHAQYERLRQRLRAFADEPLSTEDFEQAAELSNQCRSRGVAGSTVDFLICAITINRGWQILTTDGDFLSYAKAIPIKLHRSPK